MATTTSLLGEQDGRLFVDAAAFADFHGWHERCTPLRQAGPIHRVELPGRDPFWVVLSHKHVMEVERNPELFTNAEGSTYSPQRPVPDPDNPPVLTTLINMDGDEHRAHRGPHQQGQVARDLGDGQRLGSPVVAATCREETADIILDFGDGTLLEIISDSSGYEAWSLGHPKHGLYVAQGGGNVCLFQGA